MQHVAPETVGFSATRLGRVELAMRRLVDQGTMAGVVTLIARQGGIVHFQSHGMLDRETVTPMRSDAIFRIYSMTKPVTAVATMILFEEGHFLLDDPVSDFIPAFAQTKVFAGETAPGVEVVEPERPMTIRHLLMHTSGLPYGNPNGTPVQKIYAREQVFRADETLEAWVDRVARLPLAHQPGAAWTYGISHDVLGRLIEVVSGRRFDTFLKEQIFEPLGMVDTGFVVPGENLARLATVYSPDEAGGLRLSEAPGLDRSEPRAFLSGGGGLVSTASDYARFCQMLLNGGTLGGTRVLGTKTIELMTATQMSRRQIPFVPPTWPFRNGYGMALGVRTLVDVAQSGIPGTAGTYTWQGAAGTDFWIDPAEELFGILLIQVLPGPSRPGEVFRVLTYQALDE